MKRFILFAVIVIALVLIWVVFLKKQPPAENRAVIQNAVNHGWSNFTRQHPSAALPGFKTWPGKPGATHANKSLDVDTLKIQVQDAVNAGKLTPEQGKAKMDWLNGQKK
jgi:hypothetical protein